MRRTRLIALAALLSACGQGSATSPDAAGSAGVNGGPAGTSGTGAGGVAGGSAAGTQGGTTPTGSAGAAGSSSTGTAGSSSTGTAGSSSAGTAGSASAGASGSAGAAGKAGAGGTGAAGSTGSAGSAGSKGGSGGGAGGAPATSCTKANAECVASNSGCNVGSYYFYDNMWNCGPTSGFHCGPESGYACAGPNSTIDFVATSNQPAGNTAVLTFPAIQSNFSGKQLLSSFKSITSTFAETGPGKVGDYEVAWDLWFNGLANEVMVWVDTYKQVPAGKKVASSVTLGGGTWDVWWVSSSGYLAFVSTATMTSGTVDLLALLKYATTNGWLPASSVVSQLTFGIEVCSTDGKDATWTISNYSLTAN
jgi:hypothetical protein